MLPSADDPVFPLSTVDDAPAEVRSRETPIRKPDVESDILVPALRGLVIGILLAILAWAGMAWYWLGLDDWQRFNGWIIVGSGFAVIVFTTLIQFVRFDNQAHSAGQRAQRS